MAAILCASASADTPRDSSSEPTAARRFDARVVRKARAGKSTVSSERSLVAMANSGRPKCTRWTYQSPSWPVEGAGSGTVCRARCRRSRTSRVQRNVTTLWGRFRVFLSLAEKIRDVFRTCGHVDTTFSLGAPCDQGFDVDRDFPNPPADGCKVTD